MSEIIDALKDKEVMTVSYNPALPLLTIPSRDEFKVTHHKDDLAALTDIQSRRLFKKPLPAAIIFADSGTPSDDIFQTAIRLKQSNDPALRAIGVVILTDQPETYKHLETLGVVFGQMHGYKGQPPDYAALAAKSLGAKERSPA